MMSSWSAGYGISNSVWTERRQDLQTLSPFLCRLSQLLKVVVRFCQGNLFQIAILQVQIFKFLRNITQFPSQPWIIASFC